VLIFNNTRKPIEALNAKTKKLEASNDELEQAIAVRTEQLVYHAQVAESERSRYEAMLQSISDGMIITDTSGNIILINEPGKQILHAKEDSAHGTSAYAIARFLDSNGQPISQENHPINIALTKGLKSVQDVELDDPDSDSNKIIRVSATVILSKDRIIGAIASLRDITQEIQIDRMKTDFISVASHQLRTPLSAIRWFSEMLYNGDAGKLQDEQNEFAKNIVDSTHRMIELVDSLLNISRMESGRLIVDPRPTNLQSLITGVVSDLRLKIEEKQHHIKIAVHKDIDVINIDPRLIGQVYINLLTNAIKYTAKGGEISVMVWRKDGYVISQISDNGYGIPKDAQSKIFRKFFRAPNVAKVETDGTGLGMYLVKSIVTSSGGKIWLHSEEGRGTTFWFSIPESGMQKKEGEVSLDTMMF
jgi:signal transduction histidine kinase